jgi:hypothetical protein
VGVRIRGNTSYTALPAGSQKFSLNVEMDWTNPLQELMGYDALNLNNGFHDPTFCREVLYNNYVAQHIPNGRANHVVVTINGSLWGVYNNIQQFDQTMIGDYFGNNTGMRIKCANTPNGPGLVYAGTTAANYPGYEMKDPGGMTLAAAWAAHGAACNAVTNGATATWQTTIDPVFAVDASIWSVVLENILTDDDSYVNKGADFMTYRSPTDSRTYLLQTDANETFTATTWLWNRNFTATNKPFLSRVINAIPENRQRYLAHFRTAKQDLNWAYFGPIATQHRTLIDAAVQADPKKLYSYTLFQNNFTSQVTLPYTGPAGGTVPGLQQFVTDRNTSLSAVAEVVALGPTISSVTPSDATPDPASTVTISANVSPNGSAVNRVDLFYRATPSGPYTQLQMPNVGGADYSVTLPVVGDPGKRVPYYVRAVSGNAFLSQSFLPAHTEWDPSEISYTFGATGGMRITEYMYDGPSGSFVEFTNLSAAPIDLTGWSMDDDHALPGTISLSAFGTVQPGESVIVCEIDPALFRAAWNLAPSVDIIGGMGVTIGNNLARNDEINLFSSTNALTDRLSYGDTISFPGTIRANNTSAQTAAANIGQDDIAAWQLSVAGDAFGSWAASTGEAGTPGIFGTPTPTCDSVDFNNDGLFPDTQDIDDFLTVFSGGPCSNEPNCGDVDFNNDGLFPDTSDIDALLRVFSGGPCA